MYSAKLNLLYGINEAKSRILYCKKKYILSLKCFEEDEYPKEIADSSYADSPVYVCKFGESNDTKSLICLAYEDGRIVLQQTKPSDKGQYLIDKDAHGNAIFDLSWVPDRNEFVTAVADSSLCLWSIGSDLSPVQQFRGHLKAVKCVDVNRWDTNVFASGGRDCSVIIWDKRCQPSNKANEIIGAHSSQKSNNSPCVSRSNATQMQNSIVSVLFNQQCSLVSAGASDGLLKIWDLRKTYCRLKREPLSLHTLQYSGNSSFKGYTSMGLSPYKEKIYVSCLDGKIYSYHLINPTPYPVAEYYGHKPNTYYTKACLSPCGSYLLSGSNDDKAYIWLTDSPGFPVASLSGHCDEVTSMACSSGMDKVVTCCDDMRHRIFRLNLCKTDDPEIKQKLRGHAIPYEIKNRISSIDPKTAPGNIFDGVGIKDEYSPSGPSSGKNKPARDIHKEEIYSRLMMTPSQLRGKVKEEQVTPKTSGKKTLLSWLSSSKTPTRNHILHTPSTRSLNNRSASKRKLADLMECNQENCRDEDKKPAISPSKNTVLTERENVQISLTSNSVAKMLKYENNQTEHNDVAAEELECFKLIDDVDKAKPLKFTSFFTKEEDSNFKTLNKPGNGTPGKECSSPNVENRLINLNPSKLASPTANLPNFVIDGRSPHNRESPIARKRETDWLTSLCKNKYSEGVKGQNKEPKISITKRKKGKSLNFSRTGKN